MIGVFDSGSGGLGVLFGIRRKLPAAELIYLGDIKNAPYGGRSREELGALTVLDIQKLLAEGATRIVSACNSVSTAMILPMFSILSIRPFDVVEMVGPTVKALQKEKRKILLVATEATVSSGIYQNGLAKAGKEIRAVAIPDLAGMIEFGGDVERLLAVIRKAIGKEKDFGVLLLGCTHYPFVKNLFEKVLDEMGNEAEVYDPAAAVADEVSIKMEELGSGKIRFLITKESALFRARVKEMFGGGFRVELV